MRREMKVWHAVSTITIVLTLAGCLSRAGPAAPEETPRTSTPHSPPSLETSGLLAYIGSDGNVWATSPGQGWTQQVTNDATAPPEGQGRSYHRVVWFRNGGLGFAAVTRSRDRARGELYVQQALDQPSELVARSDEHFFIYLYPSPVAYEAPTDRPLLTYLIEGENGVRLHLLTGDDDGFRDQLLAVGRPFYSSWSPDGDKILWHIGGALRDNPAAEIGLYDIEDNDRRTLPYAPGAFQAPAWSPRGEDWLSVVGTADQNRLQHVTPEKTTTLTETEGQDIAFVWSSSGRHVAYAVRESNAAPFYGPIQTVNLENGRTEQVTRHAFNVLGFFWSPDGRRIAYLSRLDLPNAVWMQWRVFDLMENRDRGFTAFHPTPLMRFVVHSFGQYAQSHRFWSPDGRYLVYADRDDQGVDRVWLVDTQAEKGTDPILVDEGSMGVWSWR